MSYQARHNPITYRLGRVGWGLKRLLFNEATALVAALAALVGFFAGIVLLVSSFEPFYYAGDMTKGEAKDIARRSIVGRYGFDRAIHFTYRGTVPGHVLGREAWISRWTLPNRRDVCVYIWHADKTISYRGGCPVQSAPTARQGRAG